ncbi:MAG TPA: SIMPL domain-containing protein [Herpetosiphonaceae bacterium]
MTLTFARWHIGLIAAILVAALVLTELRSAQAVLDTPGATSAAACDQSRSIRVSGAATVNVAPDRVQIDLGIETTDATPQLVQSRNLQTSQAVLSAVKALGIDPQDIATDNYLVQPVYEDYKQYEIKGYRIEMLIRVTVRNPALTRAVLVAAFDAGANRVIGVEFSSTKLRAHRDQARALALRAAKEKADLLTTGVGAATGCVLSIEEGSHAGYSGFLYGSSAAAWSQNVIQEAPSAPSAPGAQADDTPISLGQIAVRAEVTVSFAIR